MITKSLPAFFVWMASLLLVVAASGAELKKETLAAYSAYVATQEKLFASQAQADKDYLWLDKDPARRQSARNGGIETERRAVPEIVGGMIQHWVGGTFFPNATLQTVTKVDQDYANYKNIYAPDIQEARVLSRKDDVFRVYYRIKKRKVIAVVLDTVHDIAYRSLTKTRMTISSKSDSVRQVEDPGERSEKILPPGKDDGFLWAMNSYWRMEERDGGVYVECEAITLARSLPFGMSSVAAPIIDSFASEALASTLTAKRRAVAERK